MNPVMHRRALLRTACTCGAALLSGCSASSIVNALVPSDTYRRTGALAYGAHPRHQLDVYRPAPALVGLPVVVFFYGGNWNSGERAHYLFAGEALASKHFVAVIPDYRLYPEVRFPAFLNDCAAVVQWVSRHAASYGGDPERIFLMGHSAGAYNAAMLALDPRYLATAGVARRSIRAFVGLAGPYDFLPLRNPIAKGVFGYPDTPIDTQPIHFVTREGPPALLIAGSADDIVDPGNSLRLAARLRSNAVPTREILYQGVGHAELVGALASPLRRIAPILDDVAAFVNAVT